ncbi:hypothetical protein GCM10011578_063640 [Streptomyces fuscichromogenes]|uniref:Uncharacterized protein n=1 Tax=Streptomyces fuscichromogenes TaxID=1324013 RepID=A0A917XI37_9ACTN|nr:hypothetical protein GCM10011578_063640 [Streptomyces fuscichromogenes]
MKRMDRPKCRNALSAVARRAAEAAVDTAVPPACARGRPSRPPPCPAAEAKDAMLTDGCLSGALVLAVRTG